MSQQCARTVCFTNAPFCRGEILRLSESSQGLWDQADLGLESQQLCDFEQIRQVKLIMVASPKRD